MKKKERKFKHDYLFLTELSYVGIIITPIIAALFAVVFFAHKQLILANALIILTAIDIIYMLFKIKSVRKSINYSIANYLIKEYLSDNKFYYLKDVVISFNTDSEIIDYLIVSENGLILVNLYESYSSSANDNNVTKFDKETKIINQIGEMINNLNKDKLKDNPIDFTAMPITYIIACTDNIMYINQENKEEIKQIVRKNVSEFPTLLNKFNDYKKLIEYDMSTISSIYYMFKKITLNYKSKKQ